MRHANIAPWALCLASGITLLALGAGALCTAEDTQSASTIRVLDEGLAAVAQTSAKILACSEQRPIKEPAPLRLAPGRAIPRPQSAGEGQTTLAFRVAQPVPRSESGSHLRSRRSHNRSLLQRPSIASCVEYRGTHLERARWRIRSYPAASLMSPDPLATAAADSADEPIRVISHDVQALHAERASSKATPLRSMTSEVRVLGESTTPPEDKRFCVKRLPKPGEQSPRVQLTVGG